MVGQVDGLGAVLDRETGVVDRLDALGDDGEGRHVAELLEVVPREVAVAGVCAADAVAGGTVPVSVGRRVDRQDDGFGARLLDLLEELLGFGEVVREVDLLEEDLGAVGFGGRDVVHGPAAVEGGHVEDVAGCGALDEVDFAVGVGVAAAGAGRNEEWRREVVA